MPNKTQICNIALVRVGEKHTISSIDDENPQARICKAVYDTALKEMLEDEWKFAMKQAEPTYLETEPLFEWDYIYELPADCIKPVKVNGERKGWTVKGTRIYTNDDTMNLDYVSNDITEGDFTFKFAYALAMLIASKICGSLGQAKMFPDIIKEYSEARAEAKKLDADTGGDAEYDNSGSWTTTGRSQPSPDISPTGNY